MTGGVVPAFFLVEGSSSATFSAGRIGTGSDLSSIVSQDAAVFTLSGGLVFASLSATDGGAIRIVGSDFFVDGAPVGLGPIQATSGILTGTLFNGDSLNQLFSVSGGGTIVLVPEPSTALLVAGGLWALAVRRRSRPRARPFGRPLGSAGVAGSV